MMYVVGKLIYRENKNNIWEVFVIGAKIGIENIHFWTRSR